VDSLETRVALIEDQLKDIPPREWVKDFVRPLEHSIAKIEAAVTSLAGRADSLFSAHNELLREKAAQDKKALEERTPVGWLKKWAPMFSLIATLFLLYNILSSLLQAWMKAHGF
jgi:hypothetical protein